MRALSLLKTAVRSFTLSVGLLLVGCSGGIGTISSDARSATPEGPPAWLPPYTEAQLALLAPSDTPIRVPARRVFPDLDHFVYSDEVMLTDPRDAVRVTQLVAEAVERSP